MYTNILKIAALLALVAIGFFVWAGPSSASATIGSVGSSAAPVGNAPIVVTATATLTPTATATATATSTATAVPSSTVASSTVTPTKTATSTATPVKPTATQTATATKPATATPTKSATPTKTATPTPKLAPRAPAVVSSLSTAFVVQNTDISATALISATFFDVTGTATGPITRSVAPLMNTWPPIDQRNASGLPGSPSTYQGAVVLSSNTQLAAIVNEYSGNAASLGTDFRADSYNGVGSSQADKAALLPQLLKNITDASQNKTYNSTIAIQNTNLSLSANVIITYTNIYTGTPVNSTHSGIVVPPGASVYIDMQNEVTQWSQFFGPARITADQNVAVLVNQNAAGSLLVYRGFTSADGGTSILVTQGLTNIFDTGQQLTYGSAVEGLTVDGSSTVVTVQYNNLFGGLTSTCNLPAGSTFRVDLRLAYRGLQPCPPPLDGLNRFFGSVKFTTTSTPIVALSNLQSDYSPSKGIRSSTSRAFVTTGGVTTGYAPLLMNGYLDTGTNVTWGTALEGKLLSGTGVVTITYYLSTGGGPLTDTYTAGADQIFRFDQRGQNPQTLFTLPSGTVAAAVLTSANPFVFTVNDQGGSATLGDALTVYMSQ